MVSLKMILCNPDPPGLDNVILFGDGGFTKVNPCSGEILRAGFTNKAAVPIKRGNLESQTLTEGRPHE